MNANNVGDTYAVDDSEISGENIVFTWTVGRVACMYKGNTKFIVCLKKKDASGNVLKEFNTSLASLLVLEGLETTEAVVAENPDIIEQILARLDNVTEIPQEKVTEAVSTYMEANPINVPKNLSDLKEVAETEPLEDGKEKETTAYEYDGNIFPTHSLTAKQIKADPESYMDYEGDEAPTDAMVEYANLKIDEYTAQLMETHLRKVVVNNENFSRKPEKTV